MAHDSEVSAILSVVHPGSAGHPMETRQRRNIADWPIELIIEVYHFRVVAKNSWVRDGVSQLFNCFWWSFQLRLSTGLAYEVLKKCRTDQFCQNRNFTLFVRVSP